LPTRGRFKVYIIDEVHMLSGHSFNALLKTLEEPPAHVKFLLATTDPQRLPVTVLSRCLQFHLKNMLPETIEAHLKFVLEQEKVDFEASALASLAFAANGSMRDALSLLDQAIAYNGGKITAEGTATMLGNIDQTFIVEILDALANSNAKRLLEISAQLAELGADFITVLEELLSSLHKIAVTQAVPSSTSNPSDPNSNAIASLATRLAPEDIQLYYQITLIGRRDLPLAPSARMGFEIVLLRLLAFKPAETSSQNAPKPPITAQSSTPNRTPAPAVPFQQTSVKPPVNIATVTTIHSPASAIVVSAAHTTDASVSSASSDWEVIIKKMNLTGLTLSLANHCCLLSIENNSINLELDPVQAALLTTNSRERLNQAFNQYFSKDIKLNIQTGGKGTTSSPAGIVKKMQMEKQQAAIQTLENDANVQTLLKTFNATIQPESIKSGVE
jgi:DNA polymerase-3 subunit gamma/tau